MYVCTHCVQCSKRIDMLPYMPPFIHTMQAEENPGWLKEARHGEHTPESVEYAISSFTFRARRPFDPSKLHAALNRATASLNRGAGFGSGLSAAAVERGMVGGLADPLEALESIVRVKGIAYVATAGGWNMQATLSLAGSCTYVIPGSPWWAKLDRDEWPEGLSDAITPLWDETHGDRQTEVVVIGRHMDHERVEAVLRSCVLTDDELAASPPETWETAFGDPWGWNELIAKQADEDGHFDDHGHGHAHSHDHSHSHACDNDCVDDCVKMSAARE
jgi:hypothetical protein